METKKLKEIYNEGIEQGFVKNLSFEEWEKIYLEMEKEIKQMNKKEEERLEGLQKGFREAQKIIFG